MTLEDFVRDRKTVYAVTRALEIISEAARRLPDDFKGNHPAVDWPAVAAAGNVYRHEYEVVDDWAALGERLPLGRAWFFSKTNTK